MCCSLDGFNDVLIVIIGPLICMNNDLICALNSNAVCFMFIILSAEFAQLDCL